MTRTFAALVLAWAAVGHGANRPRVAALDFNVIGLDPKLGSFYAEHLSVRLEGQGLRVTTQRDVASVLSLERQKQLLGCAEDSSACMAELAGALGVDALVTGQVAKFGKSFQVNLRILRARDAEALFVFSRLVKTEEELLEALNDAGGEAARKLLPDAPVAETRPSVGPADTAPAPSPVEVTSSGPSKPVRAGPWVVVGAGAAALVAGAVFVGRAAAAQVQLQAEPVESFTPEAARGLAQARTTEQWVGVACLALGAAAVGGGLAWHFQSADDSSVSLAFTGTGFLVEARW